MKSRISIDVDYENKPIIKIEYCESDDVRDKLVKRFLESFAYDSVLASFKFDTSKLYYCPDRPNHSVSMISPLSPIELPKAMKWQQDILDKTVNGDTPMNGKPDPQNK